MKHYLILGTSPMFALQRHLPPNFRMLFWNPDSNRRKRRKSVSCCNFRKNSPKWKPVKIGRPFCGQKSKKSRRNTGNNYFIKNLSIFHHMLVEFLWGRIFSNFLTRDRFSRLCIYVATKPFFDWKYIYKNSCFFRDKNFNYFHFLSVWHRFDRAERFVKISY